MKNERRIEILAVIKSQREAGGPVTCESVLADLAVLDQVESGAPAPARPAASPQGGASTAPSGAGARTSGSKAAGAQFVLRQTWDNRNDPDPKRKKNVVVMLADETNTEHRVYLWDPNDWETAIRIPDGSEVTCTVKKSGAHFHGTNIQPGPDRWLTGAEHAQGMGHPDIPC